MDPKRTWRTISAPLGGVALAVALALAIPVAASAAGPATVWTRQFGTSASEEALAVAADAKRNVYVAGCTSGTFSGQTSMGGNDAFVRKIRPGGRTAWTRQFGTSGNDCAWAIAVDGRGWILVAGSTDGTLSHQKSKGGLDAFVRTFRPDGRTVRTRQFGTSGNDFATAVAVDSNDRVLVAGSSNGTFSGKNSSGGEDAFLRTFRPDGSTVWTRQFGTAGADQTHGVAVDSNDRIFVAGLTSNTFSGQTSKGNADAFVRTFRPNGSTVRTRQFGTSKYDEASEVVVDSKDRVVVAGFTEGTFRGQTNKGGEDDAFLRTFRPDGSTVKTRQFGTRGKDIAWAAAVDSKDRILVAGWTNGIFPGRTSKGAADAFVRVYRH